MLPILFILSLTVGKIIAFISSGSRSISNIKLNKDIIEKEISELEVLEKPDEEVYLQIGLKYADINNFSKAIESFAFALKLNPQFVDAYFALGEIYEDTKQFNMAIENYNKSVDLLPENPKGYRKRGVVHFLNNNYTDALEDMMIVLKLNPNDAHANMIIGYIYHAQEKSVDALEYFNKYIQYTEKEQLEPRTIQLINTIKKNLMK